MNRIMARALAQEKALQDILSQTKESIYQDMLGAKPLEGVVVVKDCAFPCAIVSYQTICRAGNNFNLSPSTYIPKAQADVVRRRLDGAKTVSDLVARISDMVDTGIARFNSQDTVKLNNNTIKVLNKYL